MNFVGGLLVIGAAISLILGFLLVRRDPRQLLPWAAGLWGLMGSAWCLGSGLMTLAPGSPSFWMAARLADWGCLLSGPPAILVAGLVFRVRGWRLWTMVAVYTAYALFALYHVMTGVWMISGYHPGPWGNVGESTDGSFGVLANTWYAGFNLVLCVILAIRAWRLSHSRRYRVLLLQFLLFSLGAQIGIQVLDSWLWVTLDFPRVSSLVPVLYLFFFLVVFSPHEVPHDLVGPLFGHLNDLVFLVDAEGRMVKVSPRLAALLGATSREGKPPLFADVLSGWPELPTLWAQVHQDHRPVVKLPGTLGSGRFSLDLTPSLDRYGDVVGAVVRLTAQQSWEHAFHQFGISTRERDVCSLLLEGFDTNQIAEALFISPGTVKNHVQNVFRKTGAKNRVELVSLLRAAEGCVD